VRQFWFDLDVMGQQAIGEVPSNFRVFARRQAYRSRQKVHRPRRVDNLCRFSPLFRKQAWRCVTVKEANQRPSGHTDR
jgi:hypothetical protein